MFPEFSEKLKLIKRVHAMRSGDEVRLVLSIMRYYFNKQNVKLDMIVNVDGVKYRLVDLESLFILSPRYEKVLWSYLTLDEGDVFIDVGAHVGKYTLRIAKFVGAKVIAIEPDPENYKALLEGIRINNLNNVIALNVAAFDRECKIHLYVAPDKGKTPEGWLIGKGWSSVKHRVSGTSCEVTAKTLDKIVEDLGCHVNYIKVDVEGAEYEVLKGSRKVIENTDQKL